MLSIVIHVICGLFCRCVVIPVHRGRLKAQDIRHKAKFEFENWKLRTRPQGGSPQDQPGTRPQGGSPQDNFKIKESQPKIRNSKFAIRNYLPMHYALYSMRSDLALRTKLSILHTLYLFDLP
jgi:hypothetical protein